MMLHMPGINFTFPNVAPTGFSGGATTTGYQILSDGSTKCLNIAYLSHCCNADVYQMEHNPSCLNSTGVVTPLSLFSVVEDYFQDLINVYIQVAVSPALGTARPHIKVKHKTRRV